MGSARKRTCSTPLVERLVAMSCDLLCVTQNFQASGILFDLIDCAVEQGGFAIRRENVGPEKVANATLEKRPVRNGKKNRERRISLP